MTATRIRLRSWAARVVGVGQFVASGPARADTINPNWSPCGGKRAGDDCAIVVGMFETKPGTCVPAGDRVNGKNALECVDLGTAKERALQAQARAGKRRSAQACAFSPVAGEPPGTVLGWAGLLLLGIRRRPGKTSGWRLLLVRHTCRSRHRRRTGTGTRISDPGVGGWPAA
ncbi:MAG: hypothetical protein JW940_09005 [Polyangiaceae bacterium]|nr:hypothetical protein [Polyangiaceae bacterium]